MRLRGLMEPLITSTEFSEIKSNIQNNKFPLAIYGLSDSGRSYFINSIYEEDDRPLVIIAHSDMEAKNIYEDLSFYSLDVYYFPVREVVFYNIDAISGDLRWARLKVIKEILNTKKKIIVTSIEAFASNYTPREYYKNHIIKLKVEKEVDFKEISRILVESGYERVEMVEGKGEFALRGGILDVFPIDEEYPYRIELFGDEIDSIRRFNVESQRSIDKVKKLEIFPAKEIIIDNNIVKESSEKIRKELVESVNKISDIDLKSKLSSTINRNIEGLENLLGFETMDSYLPFFYDKMESFFDYLKNYRFILDDTERSIGKLNSTYIEFRENFTMFLEKGNILPSQAKLLMDEEKVIEKLEASEIITMDIFAKTREYLKPHSLVNLKQITLHNYQGQLEILIEEIKAK